MPCCVSFTICRMARGMSTSVERYSFSELILWGASRPSVCASAAGAAELCRMLRSSVFYRFVLTLVICKVGV